jgi:hypothetical protein
VPPVQNLSDANPLEASSQAKSGVRADCSNTLLDTVLRIPLLAILFFATTSHIGHSPHLQGARDKKSKEKIGVTLCAFASRPGNWAPSTSGKIESRTHRKVRRYDYEQGPQNELLLRADRPDLPVTKYTRHTKLNT